jgi:hypothetical protein
MEARGKGQEERKSKPCHCEEGICEAMTDVAIAENGEAHVSLEMATLSLAMTR